MFWLSYECFSIVRENFLLKRVICSHKCCEKVGPGWIKNGKKVVFITATLPPTQASIKTKFSTAIVF